MLLQLCRSLHRYLDTFQQIQIVIQLGWGIQVNTCQRTKQRSIQNLCARDLGGKAIGCIEDCWQLNPTWFKSSDVSGYWSVTWCYLALKFCGIVKDSVACPWKNWRWHWCITWIVKSTFVWCFLGTDLKRIVPLVFAEVILVKISTSSNATFCCGKKHEDEGTTSCHQQKIPNLVKENILF